MPLPPMMVSLPFPPSIRVGVVVVNAPLTWSIRTVSLPLPASTSIAPKVLRSNEKSAERSSPTSTWSWVRSTGLSAERDLVRMRATLDVQGAVGHGRRERRGSAAATGAAAIEVRGRPARRRQAMYSWSCLFSCLRFRFESAAANDRIGEDRAKAIRRYGRDRFQRMVGGSEPTYSG